MVVLQVITGQAAVQRCNASVNFPESFPPTINHEVLHEHFHKVAGEMLGIHKVKDMKPTMGSEDFSFFQEEIPGYFFFLGMQNQTLGRLQPEHSHYFQINEDVLPLGSALHASLAATCLFEFRPQLHLRQGKYHDEL